MLLTLGTLSDLGTMRGGRCRSRGTAVRRICRILRHILPLSPVSSSSLLRLSISVYTPAVALAVSSFSNSQAPSVSAPQELGRGALRL